ncbi:TetR/AcrR family transcriptional regulator [Williamsia sterculiae]|uniref:Transcriptional regulator, TetR family n=1 Tax=Williamsia sterculiae TaxID=1344003 RepID=A0A1N7ER67_9NOCA|nr:TetR/AcrR family transcriptional regulator [Williamsia sterculiae]SIR90603.1 transcriptional regulator, TetR family [Williamsia sterculiae]
MSKKAGSAVTRRSPRVERAQREVLILDAAVDVFGRYGYAGASLSTIAHTAEVSKTLVLQHFGSKEQLYVACVERAGRNLADRIEDVLNRDQTAIETAAQTLETMFAGLQDRPHDWSVLTDRTTERGSVARDSAKQYRDHITGQAARGVAALTPAHVEFDTDDLALLTEIWTHTVTAVVQWWIRHPRHSAESMAQRCRHILTSLTQLR